MRLHRLASRAPRLVGSPWTFTAVTGALLAWIVAGTAVGWPEFWVFWPSTAASVAALLLVLLLQYTQNRDTRAIQLKLDELIRSLGDARTKLVRLEQLSDEELDQVEEEFHRLRTEQLERDSQAPQDGP